MMAPAKKRVYRFDGFRLDATERRLERDGLDIYLQPKTFDTLIYLVERHGSLVKKNEMMDALWSDAFVTENALTRCIKEVREALEDDAYQPHFIKTVPRVGYRFIAEVEEISIFKEEQEEETEEELATVIAPQSRAVLSDDAVIVPYVPPRLPTFFGRLGRTEGLALVVSLTLLVGLAATLLWWQPWRRTQAPPDQRLISTFPGSHRGASFSPDSGQIAFTNTDGGLPQVWIKSLDQGEAVQITSGNDPAHRPRWSPAGDNIVYVRRSQGTSGIWSVSPEGGAPQKIIENGRNPNWSWDGKRLVFERGYDIWTRTRMGQISEGLKEFRRQTCCWRSACPRFHLTAR